MKEIGLRRKTQQNSQTPFIFHDQVLLRNPNFQNIKKHRHKNHLPDRKVIADKTKIPIDEKVMIKLFLDFSKFFSYRSTNCINNIF